MPSVHDRHPTLLATLSRLISNRGFHVLFRYVQQQQQQQQQQEVCCGCCEKLICTDGKDIFEESNQVEVSQLNRLKNEPSEAANLKKGEKTGNERVNDRTKRIGLCTAIELVIGQKIDTARNRKSLKLCAKCIKQLEASISFRANLLLALYDTVSSLSHPESTDQASKILNIHRQSPLPRNANETHTEESSLQPVRNSMGNFEKNSISTSETTDNLVSSDTGEETSNGTCDRFAQRGDRAVASRLSPTIQQDTDIESEIDVCSGEDDEVLELDAAKNETVNISSSSSESDIEVCDYKPAGKRMKKYQNTLASPIFF